MVNVTACIPAWNDDFSLMFSVPAIAPYVDEVLVFDDSSDDDTPLVLSELKSVIPNLRTHRHHGNPLGWTESRNMLLRMAKTDGLLFIDADDIFYSDKISQLEKVYRNGKPCTQLGLVEAVGDFRHGTGRGWRQPHYDRCHCYIDRSKVPNVRWDHQRTYTFPVFPGNGTKSHSVLFLHAKKVKSDRRLAARYRIRSGQRSVGDDCHDLAMKSLFFGAVDPVKPWPYWAPKLPSCVKECNRFEIVYENGFPVDRIDHENCCDLRYIQAARAVS